MESKKSNLRSITTSIINQLWNRGDPDKAGLAALRTSKTIQSHGASQIWPLILSRLSDEDLSIDGKPTVVEQSIFGGLRCYALYQQGQDQGAFDPHGPELFFAMASIRKDNDLRPALDRRVKILLGTRNYSCLENELVHLVQIAKSKGYSQPLNFSALTQDLKCFQYPDGVRQVALKWGRQYYW